MGGKGSGGNRRGAGRPRKTQEEGALTGSRRTRSRARKQRAEIKTGNPNQPDSATTAAGSQPATAAASDSTPGVPLAPDRLTLGELAEWNWLAPLAFKAGKLTDMDVPALVDLCQRRVLYRQLLDGAYTAGLEQLGPTGNLATHPHVAKLTSLAAKVDALMDKFGLSPTGREAVSAEPATDPFAEFDGAGESRSIAVN